MNYICFNMFVDSKDVAINKLCKYFCLDEIAAENALQYGCSAESFINDLQINLRNFDSSSVNIIGRHITTASVDTISSFTENGLYNLSQSLQFDTPLSRFLKRYGIRIDVENKVFHFREWHIPISEKKTSDHICFKGRERVCTWYDGCEEFKKIASLGHKLYSLGATLEFFVAGTLDEMLDYSTVSHCPEILDTIDQIICSLNNSYSTCTYPLCSNWITHYPQCYLVEFASVLSNLDTYCPISYLNAYSEIKESLKWSEVTYDDYYERRVPQRVFDNRYLIQTFISAYIYHDNEQYGSLQPGLSSPPSALTIYRIEDGQLKCLL